MEHLNRFHKRNRITWLLASTIIVALLPLHVSALEQPDTEEIERVGLANNFVSTQGKHDWLYTGMEVSFVSLNALDLALTHLSLKKGARELNPIARVYIQNVPLSVLVKGSVTAGTLFTLRKLKRQDKKGAYITMGLLNLMYGFVVNHNFTIYFGL